MPAIEPAEIPQGELLTMCSEAGLTKEQIEAVILNRNHYMWVTREVDDMIETAERTLANPAVVQASRQIRKEAAKKAENRKRATREMWIVGTGELAFVPLLIFGTEYLGAWIIVIALVWLFALFRLADWVNKRAER